MVNNSKRTLMLLYDMLPSKLQLNLYLRKRRKIYNNDPYFQVLKPYFNKSQKAIDIGANLGVFTAYLLKYFSHVIAIEPNPDMVQKIKQLLGKQNLTIIEGAAGNENRTVELTIPTINGQELTGWAKVNSTDFTAEINSVIYKTITVNQYKLDQFSYSNLGFIKIDVEGYELETLKGAENTLIRNKPILFIEIEDRHIGKGHFKEVDYYLKQLGYNGQYLYENKLFSTNSFEVEKFQKIENADQSNERNIYINNFIYSFKE